MQNRKFGANREDQILKWSKSDEIYTEIFMYETLYRIGKVISVFF